MQFFRSLRLSLSQTPGPSSASKPSLSHQEASNYDSNAGTHQVTVPDSSCGEDSGNGSRTNRSTVCYLLKIPPEIRFIIYTYLSLDIQITETIEVFTLPPYKIKRKYRLSTKVTDDYVRKNVIRHRMPAMTQVCTQLRSEVIAFPGKQCHLTLPSPASSRVFTPGCSWINYDMITHLRMPQWNMEEPSKIRQHCAKLRIVIIDLDWNAYHENELSIAVHKLQRHQALVLSKANLPTTPTATTTTTTTQLDAYWQEMESILSQYGSELYFLRKETLVLGLDPTRSFELELRYLMVLDANGLRRREQYMSLNWDTGLVGAIGKVREYYPSTGRAEE